MTNPEKEPTQSYQFTLPDAVRKLLEQNNERQRSSQENNQKKQLQIASTITDPHLRAIAKRYEEPLARIITQHKPDQDPGVDFLMKILIAAMASVSWTTTTSLSDEQIITNPEKAPRGYLIVMPPGHSALKTIDSMAQPTRMGASYIAFRPEQVTDKYAATLLAYALSAIIQNASPPPPQSPHYPRGVDLMLLRTANSYSAKGTILDQMPRGKFSAFINEYIKFFGPEKLKEILKEDCPKRQSLFTHLDMEIFGSPAKNPRERSGRETIYIHTFISSLTEQENPDESSRRENIIRVMREYHDWAKHL